MIFTVLCPPWIWTLIQALQFTNSRGIKFMKIYGVDTFRSTQIIFNNQGIVLPLWLHFNLRNSLSHLLLSYWDLSSEYENIWIYRLFFYLCNFPSLYIIFGLRYFFCTANCSLFIFGRTCSKYVSINRQKNLVKKDRFDLCYHT